MRYRAFLLISALALLTGFRSLACGPYYYEPEYYFMYRVSDNYLPSFLWKTQPFDYNFESEDNCRLWQKQTTSSPARTASSNTASYSNGGIRLVFGRPSAFSIFS